MREKRREEKRREEERTEEERERKGGREGEEVILLQFPWSRTKLTAPRRDRDRRRRRRRKWRGMVIGWWSGRAPGKRGAGRMAKEGVAYDGSSLRSLPTAPVQLLITARHLSGLNVVRWQWIWECDLPPPPTLPPPLPPPTSSPGVLLPTSHNHRSTQHLYIFRWFIFLLMFPIVMVAMISDVCRGPFKHLRFLYLFNKRQLKVNQTEQLHTQRNSSNILSYKII